jgi:GTP diphosphokinase / guanosine-3',5'-bis(diphosphate) 3'-diphosphatase
VESGVTTLPVPTVETYERFMERCEIFFPHSVCVTISICYALAKHYHRHDVRKDERDATGVPLRYFEHPRRVALFLLDELALADSDLVMMALLHDTIEDTRLAPEAITQVCGADVARRLMLVSKKPKQGFHQRLIDHGDYKVLFLKIADRIDNNRAMAMSAPTFVAKQVAETREMYYPLAALAADRAPSEVRLKGLQLQRILVDVTERIAKGST